jgi:preprotein translocase subunit YajC
MNLEELGFIIILGVVVAFYLIFIRPAQHDQKRHQQTIRDLRVGDDVVTTAGFFGRIREIRTPENGPVQLVIDLGSGLEVRALTSSISQRLSSQEQPAEPAETGAKGA